MTGTVLHGIERPTAETGAPPTARAEQAAPGAALHLTHGLVAIGNGPDYCLCGHTWPCDRRAD
jgi:hypothetical protein